MATHITKQTIENAAAATRTFDITTAGLCLRVSRSGAKTWALRYRAHGQRREIVLGSVGNVTVTQARRLALKARARLADGVDPLSARDDARKSAVAAKTRVTFAVFAETYCTTVAKKPASKRLDRTLLDKHLLPALGRIPIAEVSRVDAQQLHAALTARKKPVMANRAWSLLSHIITEAAARGYRDAPLPRKCIKRNDERGRDRYLSPTEHATLWKVLTDIEATEYRDSAHALQLLLLTGCRKSEVVRLSWVEVDIDSSCLRLVDSKTGKRTIPLEPPAIAILERRKAEKASAFVFPNRDGTAPRDNVERAWKLARSTAKLDGLHIHDLRHSWASAAVAAGLSLTEIGKLLGHASAQTTQRYAHVSDQVAIDASKRVGERMKTIIAASHRLHAVK